MNIGKAIREIRKRKGVSQQELAERCELTYTYLSLIETGKRKPHSDKIERICRVLEVPEPVLYFLATEVEDVPSEKKLVYESIFPSMKDLLMNTLIKTEGK